MHLAPKDAPEPAGIVGEALVLYYIELLGDDDEYYDRIANYLANRTT